MLIVAYELCAIIYLGFYAEIPFGFNAVINYFSLIGLWGLAYKKRLLFRYVWVVIFGALILSLLNNFLVMPFVYYNAELEVSSIITVLAFSLPTLLVALALFKYSHKNNELWQNT